MKSICNNYSEWQSMLMMPERLAYGQQQDVVVEQEEEQKEARERPEQEKTLEHLA